MAGERVHEVAPTTVRAWLEQGEAVLVDVREGYEHLSERVRGSAHEPLSDFDPGRVRERFGEKRVVFHCVSGKRSHDAAERYAQAGAGEAYHMAGGIEAWKSSGEAVEKPAGGPPIPVMRQVQITAGSLVAMGTALGYWVSPWFLVVPAFVGCGLVFAGATGWCGMAKMLGVMPWNRASCGADGSCAQSPSPSI